MLYKSYVFMNIYLYCVWCFRDERLSESWHLIGHVRSLNFHIGEKAKKPEKSFISIKLFSIIISILCCVLFMNVNKNMK